MYNFIIWQDSELRQNILSFKTIQNTPTYKFLPFSASEDQQLAGKKKFYFTSAGM